MRTTPTITPTAITAFTPPDSPPPPVVEFPPDDVVVVVLDADIDVVLALDSTGL
jgi:hypothetical protein